MPEKTGAIATYCITSLAELERELDASLREWNDIVHTDPLASVFQGPGWCMNWYRSYTRTIRRSLLQSAMATD